MGLAGAVRGRAWTTTTQAAPDADRPRDLVDRHFTATRPNQLWVSDFTYVATWRGFVYVAFVIDVFARRIVGLAGLLVPAHRLRPRRARASDLRPLRRPRRRLGPSQRPRHAVSVDAVHRSARGRRHRAVGREPRRFVRQCARRIDDRPLQDGGDSPARARGGISRPSNSRRSTGWIGSTRAGCSSRLATCRRRNTRRATMSRPQWPDSH